MAFSLEVGEHSSLRVYLELQDRVNDFLSRRMVEHTAEATIPFYATNTSNLPESTALNQFNSLVSRYNLERSRPIPCYQKLEEISETAIKQFGSIYGL